MKKSILLGLLLVFAFPFATTNATMKYFKLNNTPVFDTGHTYIKTQPQQYNLYEQSLEKCFSYNPVEIDRNRSHLSNYL